MNDYDEHLHKLGQRTLVELKTHGLAPSAENYAVWLAGLQNHNRELASALRELRQQPGPIDEAKLTSLYEQYIVSHSHTNDLIMDNFSNSLTTTSHALKDASNNAAVYGGTLNAASSRIATIGRGELDDLIVELASETDKMRERTDGMQQELAMRQDEIDSLRSELETARKASNLDELTGIGNRRFFDWHLRKTMHEAEQDGRRFSLMMIDVDHFKQFNDNHGHQIGDIVLRLIAGLLTQQVKGQDVVARYGGEEFAVILPETDLPGARSLGERICTNIARQRPRIKSKKLDLDPITLSIGVAVWEHGQPSSVVVERADKALYLAKANGRNRVCTEADLPVDDISSTEELVIETTS